MTTTENDLMCTLDAAKGIIEAYGITPETNESRQRLLDWIVTIPSFEERVTIMVKALEGENE